MIKLPNRGIIEVVGTDAATFLNNLVTNEISAMPVETACFCGLLTAQGKYLFDIFVYRQDAETFLLDSNHAQELAQKLAVYKMRALVQIKMREDLAVFADIHPPCHPALDAGPCAEKDDPRSHEIPQQVRDDRGVVRDDRVVVRDDNFLFQDPRIDEMGFRVFAPASSQQAQIYGEYEAHRLALGIPDLPHDLIRDKDFALEGLMDELHGIDFHKGCYVGQEMTSRMKRRGTVKQKLCRVKIANSQIPSDTPILAGETEIGRVRSNNGVLGMALVRFDRWQQAREAKQKLLANGIEITIDPPEWQLIAGQ